MRQYLRGMKYDVIVLEAGLAICDRHPRIAIGFENRSRGARGARQHLFELGVHPHEGVLKSANVFEYIEHAEDCQCGAPSRLRRHGEAHPRRGWTA